jgi:hypothetical protein
MHLFFFSMVISIFFLGGWEFPNFLFSFFLSLFTNSFFLVV